MDNTEDKNPVQFVSWDELKARPNPEWLVKNVLPKQALALLYGPPGSMKSFVAVDIAAHVASGLPFWHGYRIPVQSDKSSRLVVYVAAEGGGGLSKRARGWSIEHPLAKPHIHFILNPLMFQKDSDDLNCLLAELDNHTTGEMFQHPETGEMLQEQFAPALIIIDTLARCFEGDENKQQDMKQFIDACDIVRTRYNTTVLVIHHTGKDENKERGASSLYGALDTKFKLTQCGDYEAVSLACEKQKDTEALPPFDISWVRVPLPLRPGEVLDPEDEGDEFALSTVVLRQPAEDAPKVLNPAGQETREKILAALADGPKPLTELILITNRKKSALYDQCGSLKDEGVIQSFKLGGQWHYRLTPSKTKK